MVRFSTVPLSRAGTYIVSQAFTYYAIAALASLFYAIHLIVNRKFLLENVSPIMFSFGSNMFSSIFSLIFLYLSNDLKEIRKIEKTSWMLIIILGLSIGVLTRILLFIGQAVSSATDAGFLYATTPIYALIASYFFLKETINTQQLFTIIVMIFGVFFLTTKGEFVFHAGYLFLITCYMLTGCEKSVSRKVILLGVNPRILTSLTLTVGAIGLFIVAFFTASLNFVQWQIYLFSGLFYFLAILGKNLALSRIKAGIVGSLLLLVPVFTTLIALTILHEQITILQSVGGALILGGGYLLCKPTTTGAQALVSKRTEMPARPPRVPAVAWGRPIIQHFLMLGFRIGIVGVVLFGIGVLFSTYWRLPERPAYQRLTASPRLAGVLPLANSHPSPTLPQRVPVPADLSTLPMRPQRADRSVKVPLGPNSAPPSPQVSPLLSTLTYFDPEAEAWRFVRGSTDPQDLITFLTAYPATRFAVPAFRRLHQLQRQPQMTSPPEASASAGTGPEPPRIYIHIRREEDRGAARSLARKLHAQGFLVPAIERLAHLGPRVSQLRCFHQAAQPEAQAIVDFLTALGIEVTLRHMAGYEASGVTRPRHYELWFAPGEPREPS